MGYLRRKKHPWRNGLLIAAVALPVLYAVGGFLVLPPIARAQAEKRAAAALQRPVSIGKLRINPFALSVTVERLDVREPDGSASFVGWERLHVNLQLASIWSDEWRFAAIELEAPHGRVVARANGQLNFSDLVQSGAAPGEAAGTEKIDEGTPALASRPVHIARLVLSRAQLDFRDEARAQPFTTTLGPVSLFVQDFRTVNEGNAPYTFEAVTESGEKLSWRGGIRSAPFRSRGELTVSDIVLKKYSPYYADRVGVDVTAGTLTVHGRYDFNFDARDRVLRLLDGALELRDLVVVERASGTPVLELPRAEIKGATADGLALSADVREIAATGGRLRLRREKDGSINLLSLLQPPAGAAAATTTAASTPPPTPAAAPEENTLAPSPSGNPPTPNAGGKVALTVGELALREFAVEIEDLVPATPAKLAAERVDFSLRDFTLAEGASMPLQLALDWQPKGAMRVKGMVALRPGAAELQVELDGFALPPLNPYLAPAFRGRLEQGLVSLGGKAVLAPLGEGAPDATFEGQAWLEKFSIVEAGGREAAGFSDFVVSGIKVATQPRFTAHVAEVNLAGPRAVVVVNPDRTLNWTSLLPAPDQAPTEKPAEAAPVVFAAADPATEKAEAQVDLEIGRVVIAGGQVGFVDESITPRVELSVVEFAGSVAGLSSANPGRGEVDLTAKVGGAPFAVAGRLDVLAPEPSVDLKVDLMNLDLRPLSPYSGRYAGFELARGSLQLDIATKLAERNLESANVVTLDGFTFGAPTSSPDATKLPVRLGVALLKDASGQIVLDVPVQGSLDDPEFRIGRVVGRVIGNLLAKAATSPFALLGSMFGGGGEDWGWQDFAPGESALSDEGRRKLNALARALQERPALTLALSGGAATEADAAALRARQLEETLQMAWRDRALAAADPAAPPADVGPMPDEERAATVKHLFDRKFPPGSELGTPLPPAPPILSPPSGDERHWIKKVVDWVMNKEERRLKSFREEQEEIQRRYLEEAKKVVEAGLPQEVMLERLASAEPADEAVLAALAEARLGAVQDYLVGAGVGLERLNRVTPGTEAEREQPAEAEPPARARVILQLQ